jgi:hyperosmotically inducible protein
MSMKSLPAMALGLALAGLPLAGCHHDDNGVQAVEASRDAQGNAEVHVNGEEVKHNVDQAGEQVRQGAQEVQQGVEQGAEQVGNALQQGAEQVAAGAQKVGEKVGPVVRDVLDDADITARVKARLIADPEIRSLQIDVDTVDGRVSLNGKLASAAQRDEAVKLAAHTPGVRQVVSLLQVAGQPLAPPTTVPASPPS